MAAPAVGANSAGMEAAEMANRLDREIAIARRELACLEAEQR